MNIMKLGKEEKKRRKKIQQLMKTVQENLCLTCPVQGDCCRYFFIFEGHKIKTRHACKYLDEKTNLCYIYDKCHVINPNCMPLEQALIEGQLPEKCPYMEMVGYPEGVSPKIDYLPDTLSKSARFNWEIFNDSHRDFVTKYFDERLHWADFFMGLDKILERLREKINNI